MIETATIYRFINNHNYELTACKNRIVNTKTCREVKITEKSRSLGAYVGGKFIPLSKFDDLTELIKKEAKGSSALNSLLIQLEEAETENPLLFT